MRSPRPGMYNGGGTATSVLQLPRCSGPSAGRRAAAQRDHAAAFGSRWPWCYGHAARYRGPRGGPQACSPWSDVLVVLASVTRRAPATSSSCDCYSANPKVYVGGTRLMRSLRRDADGGQVAIGAAEPARHRWDRVLSSVTEQNSRSFGLICRWEPRMSPNLPKVTLIDADTAGRGQSTSSRTPDPPLQLEARRPDHRRHAPRGDQTGADHPRARRERALRAAGRLDRPAPAHGRLHLRARRDQARRRRCGRDRSARS